MLYIGQILNVPKESNNDNNTSTITYTVQSGDSLYSISRMFNTTVDELKQLNNLTSNILSVGQILQIPNNSSENNDTEQYLEHIVTKGNSLYSLAKTYNTTVDEIRQLNNLTADTLQIGQILLIPLTSNPQLNITYTVKSGDSLYSIAKNYGVTVNAIKSLNNLTSNLLSVGQTLLIPV